METYPSIVRHTFEQSDKNYHSKPDAFVIGCYLQIGLAQFVCCRQTGYVYDSQPVQPTFTGNYQQAIWLLSM